MTRVSEAHLITGFPTFTARRLARRISERAEKVFLLCQKKFEDAARNFVRSCEQDGLPGPIEVLVGDILDLDLGLSGREISRLARSVTRVHHLAAIYYLGETLGLTERVNVFGTRNVLDFVADLPKLERFVFFSTAFVSGNRTGVILEDELWEGQKFRNAYERTKFEAEQLVRARMKDLPISVMRPSVVVGDSKTGEIDRLDGPYYLIRTLVHFPPALPLPLLEGGVYPLNMVPVDFVAAAADALSRDPAAVGRTFHLTDPNPLSARKVADLVADLAGRPRPKGSLPSAGIRTLIRLPGVERFFRAQRHFIEYLCQLVIYNCMNTLTCLAGTGITCPPFPQYAPALVAFVQAQAAGGPGNRSQVSTVGSGVAAPLGVAASDRGETLGIGASEEDAFY